MADTQPVTQSENTSKHPAPSFAKSLFAGHLHDEMVFPFPQIKKDEQEMLNLILENFRKFAAENIDSVKIDREAKVPAELIRGLGEMGLFGLQVPEKLGGIGLSQMAYGRVFEEVGVIDSSIAATLGAHMSIGMKGLLLFGNDEQKARFLPKLASGEMLAAFALTEPGAGSDAYSIKSRAVKQSDGSYILNGNKIWITNGGIADFFTVFAKTEEDVRGKKEDRVTAFIVTRDMKGFSSGKEEHKMGIRGSSTTELAFSDIRIPPENVLGETGQGFKMAMEILNSGRLGLATGCVGGAKKLLALAARHATERKQFGRSISEFGQIKEKIGRMAMNIYVNESIAYLTCGLIDADVPDYSVESAICKVSASEMVWDVANEATQIAGGSSYMQEYPYERMLRDSRINMIFEGTNEILRLFIALTGMKGVGDSLKLVGEALNDPIKSMGVLYEYFVVQKLSRSFQKDSLNRAHPELKREAALIEDHVQDLATVVERSIRKYKKKILEKQFVQKRVAEIAMELYRMLAVVSRATYAAETMGADKARSELLMTKAFCQEASRRVTRNVRNMDRNIDEELKKLSDVVCQELSYPIHLF